MSLSDEIIVSLEAFVDLLEQTSITVKEYQRLTQAIREWPTDCPVEQCVKETIADIVAARELAKLPPLMIEDCEKVKKHFTTFGWE